MDDETIGQFCQLIRGLFQAGVKPVFNQPHVSGDEKAKVVFRVFVFKVGMLPDVVDPLTHQIF